MPGKLSFVQESWFERMVALAIVLNAITLSLETYSGVMAEYGTLLKAIDLGFVVFFVAELCLRLLSLGRKFWTDGWHWFDVTIVTLSVLPFLGFAAFGNVSAFRALRLLRLLSVIPAFRQVFGGVIRALRDSASLMGVLTVLITVFSIVASNLFGTTDPEHFANLHTAMFTLFQIITLDAWSDIVRPLMAVFPIAPLFFVFFIVVVGFVLMSTIIGVCATAMSQFKKVE